MESLQAGGVPEQPRTITSQNQQVGVASAEGGRSPRYEPRRQVAGTAADLLESVWGNQSQIPIQTGRSEVPGDRCVRCPEIEDSRMWMQPRGRPHSSPPH